jgi:hypothetical protein
LTWINPGAHGGWYSRNGLARRCGGEWRGYGQLGAEGQVGPDAEEVHFHGASFLVNFKDFDFPFPFAFTKGWIRLLGLVRRFGRQHGFHQRTLLPEAGHDASKRDRGQRRLRGFRRSGWRRWRFQAKNIAVHDALKGVVHGDGVDPRG